MANKLRTALLLLLLILGFYSRSQVTDSISINNSIVKHPDYESLTLRLYYEAKWDSLLNTGKEAIRNGYDYFYMQVRTGAAAYFLGNYALAAKYLERAAILYGDDDFTNELLFYCYIFTGRPYQALLKKENLSQALRSRLSGKPGTTLFLEGGPLVTDGKLYADKLLKIDTISFSDKYYEKDAIYLVTGIRQPLKERYWITVSVSYLNFNKHRDVQIKYWDTLAGNYKVKQSEYYISPTFTLNKRLSISPSFRITNTEVTEPIISGDSITNLYLGPEVAKHFNDYLLGTELLYASHFWKESTGVWQLKTGDVKTWQVSGSLVVLPLGNLNLYTVSILTWKSETNDKPLVFTQSCGLKIYNRTWLELAGTVGNIAGTTEYNGQLLNNQINRSQYRLSSILLIDISQKLRLSLRYQYMKNESPAWFLDPEYKLFERSYTYNRHIITGGLTWHVL